MEFRQLGKHGLSVSSLGLGTRTWGLDTDPHEAAEILQAFLQAGGDFVQIETDPGHPEPLDVLGQLLKSGAPRHQMKICLRSGFFPVDRRGPALPGRGPLLDALDNALRALGTDHVDVWIASGPLRTVALEETLSALQIALQSGRARYVGVGNLCWWNGGAAFATARSNGWDLSAWESQVSLLRPSILSNSAEELRGSGLGIIAAAPLAGGVLTGKYRHSTPPDSRATSPRFRKEIDGYLQTGTSVGVIEAVVKAAEGMERSAAQVALSWVRAVPGVATAVIGPRTLRQTSHLLETVDWRLPAALYEVLTEVATRR